MKNLIIQNAKGPGGLPVSSRKKTSSLQVVEVSVDENHQKRFTVLDSFRYKVGDEASWLSAFKKAEHFVVRSLPEFLYLVGWHGTKKSCFRPVYCIPSDVAGKFWLNIPFYGYYYYERGGYVYIENGGLKYFDSVWDAYLTYKETVDSYTIWPLQSEWAKYTLDKIQQH